MEGRGGVVAEIRQLNIVYFLSCMGRIDFPHLIRVDHHLNRNGVFLRDIKRWLANLRGKAMPETFTWSYKRRHKKGYVWQDLSDDDLITPISDNEYVLKGSQMLSHSTIDPPDSDLYAAEKKSCLYKKLQPAANFEEAAFQMHHITKTSFETDDQEPPPCHNSSSFDVDAVNIQGDSSTIKANSPNQEHSKERSSTEDSRFYCSLFLKKKINKSSDVEYKEKHSKEMGCSTTTCSFSSSANNSLPQSQSVPLGKSSKRRHLSMFRNMINCGAVNTNDAVFVRLNRNSKTYSFKQPPNRNSNKDLIIRKETRDTACTFGSASRIFRTCMEEQQLERPQKPHNSTSTASKSDDRNQKKAASAYRPIRGPHCSHCKKQFNPEKLHSHMKSCKGTKSLSQSAAASVAENKMQ